MATQVLRINGKRFNRKKRVINWDGGYAMLLSPSPKKWCTVEASMHQPVHSAGSACSGTHSRSNALQRNIHWAIEQFDSSCWSCAPGPDSAVSNAARGLRQKRRRKDISRLVPRSNRCQSRQDDDYHFAFDLIFLHISSILIILTMSAFFPLLRRGRMAIDAATWTANNGPRNDSL